jgi:hypothetical protein
VVAGLPEDAMNQVELTSEEEEALNDVLTHRLSELEIEILHTDHSAFREMLKRRRELLARVADRLSRSNKAVPPA